VKLNTGRRFSRTAAINSSTRASGRLLTDNSTSPGFSPYRAATDSEATSLTRIPVSASNLIPSHRPDGSPRRVFSTGFGNAFNFSAGAAGSLAGSSPVAAAAAGFSAAAAETETVTAAADFETEAEAADSETGVFATGAAVAGAAEAGAAAAGAAAAEAAARAEAAATGGAAAGVSRAGVSGAGVSTAATAAGGCFATFASACVPSLVVAYKVAPLMTSIAGPASNDNLDMIWHPLGKYDLV
jgi:hypothetical protein